MNTKRPTTLRQMMRKLQAEKDHKEMIRWIKRHPHSPEAVAWREKEEARVMKKYQAQREAEERRETRLARRKQRAARISTAVIREHFVADTTHPSGLRAIVDSGRNHVAKVIQVRTTSREPRWKISVRFDDAVRTMWATRALNKLNQTKP